MTSRRTLLCLALLAAAAASGAMLGRGRQRAFTACDEFVHGCAALTASGVVVGRVDRSAGSLGVEGPMAEATLTDGSGSVYEWEYHGSFSTALLEGAIRPSSIDALIDRAIPRKLVFLGDDHRLPESQALLCDIVRRIAARVGSVHLLLEMVPRESARALADRLANGAAPDLVALRELLGWKDIDPFGSGHADLVRLGCLPAVTVDGVEPESLFSATEWRAANPEGLALQWFRQRDEGTAAIIRDTVAAEPDGRVVVVVYGCLHLLGPAHLPDKVALPSVVAVSVSPALYRRWYQDAPESEVMEFGEDRYFLPLAGAQNLASEEDLGRQLTLYKALVAAAAR